MAYPSKKAMHIASFGLCFLVLFSGAFYAGALFGKAYEFHKIVFELPKAENIRVSLRRMVNLDQSYGQFQQDLWVAYTTGRCKKNCFYVDVGSADGEDISNTKLLDVQGWKGICIDPFPTNMKKRTCKLCQQPVSSKSGARVKFRAAGYLGSIESDSAKFRTDAGQAPLVDLVTVTLDEVLEKAGAPRWIDYMNIDIEGGEYDALLGLSLDRYEVGVFTIEHNYQTEKREKISTLLEARGYVRIRSWEVDDWYVHRSLANRFKTYIAYSTSTRS